ncbi:MAG: 2-amino-4-hydroxy-6-hydroxymethyldihydropteridine diphosphokinase [Gammaproteobacteria bacterium]|nr:MAG: 2-amino-4-hydroxy-6-hydroxymethyldihydropteridine diphosphokinase [Gammaproteobacteria bacterium]
MTTFYVGIGSNLEPVKHIKKALGILEGRFGELQRSPIYQNPAVGFEGPDFLNMVIAFESDTVVIELPALLQNIEAQVGLAPEQKRKFRSRIIDIDLLLADNIVYKDQNLTLPRPGICQFAFILKPLLDLCPDLSDPKTKQPYSTAMNQLAQEYDISKLQRIVFSEEK